MKKMYMFTANWKQLQCIALALFLSLFIAEQVLAAVPANNLCSNAISITCGSLTSGTTVDATADAAGFCGTSNNTAGVWYTFVGNGTPVILSTCSGMGGSASYDAKISVYTGACGSLSCVTGIDDYCDLAPHVSFTATLGTTYRVLVHGFSGETGNFTLALSCGAPANDLCSAAIPLACGQTVNGITTGSTTDAVSFCGTALNTAGGVWYSFTGNGSATTLSLCGASFYDTRIGVFSGTCGSLTCVVGNNNFCNPLSQVTFTTVLGTNYYVLVTGSGTATGLFELSRSCPSATPNITTTGTLSSFTTCTGVASAQQTFTTSGTNLSANLVVTAPTDFEVSLTSGSGFGSSVSLAPSSGTVNTTTIYVRLSASASGSPSGNIACTSTGATTKNVAASGTVTPNASIASVTGTTPVCIGATPTYSANSVVLGGGTGAWSSSNPAVATVNSSGVVTAIGSGTCNIIYTITGGCSGTKTAQQSITVNPTLQASVVIAASATSICPASTVTFTATPTNPGSTPFYQWQVNGSNTGLNSATFTSSTLNNNAAVTCILTSNASPCLTGSPATSNTITITVNPNLPASVSIATNTTTICAGTVATFTATATNGGTTPAYQWQVNGSNTGLNSATFTSSTLNNNAAITCILTSNASPCLTGSPATSNTVTMTVVPLVPASVAVAASATTICQETMVTFTATPTNGGTSPAYQWKLNGNNVGTNSPFYSNFSLNHNDVVFCVMTSNSTATCLSNSPATSNLITMTVNPLLPASASISSSATSICPATTVTFTILPGNPGPSPAFQWQVNGSNVGVTSQTYITSSLNDQDAVTCVMTSNTSPCLVGSPVTSNTITMTVNTNLSPSVVIAGSETTICPGNNVTFVATPTDAGGSSSYQWKLNGNNVGTNSAAYTTSFLINGDIVICEFTTTPTACMTGTFAISNPITMTVNPNLPASVNITANAASICPSGSVTFTATPTNGGSGPIYQWEVNGTPVGFNNPVFTSNSLNNNDAVVCILTSDATCVTGSPATSNTINMIVDPILPVSVSISASATTICQGAAFFNATPVNGGNSPTYQWMVNGLPDGTNSSSFTTSTLNNNDVVSCVMTSNVACPSGSPATSNSIVMTVHPNLVASVSISASTSTVCSGSAVTFTPAPVNGGTLPGYIWYVNGVNSGSGSTFITTTLNNNDAVHCLMFSNYNVCLTGSPATSNTLNTTVLALPTVNANASATTVCIGTSVALTGSGTAISYAWSGGVTNGAGFVPTSTVTYTVTGTGANSCTKTASIEVKVNSLPVVNANTTSPAVCTGNSVTLTGGGAISYTWSGGVTNGVGFVPGGTLSYTVTGTDGNSCSNTATVTVTVNPLPTVNANANPGTVVCAGTSITLTGSGTSTLYAWSNGAKDDEGFVPTNTLSYVVTGTDANSCTNTASITITVNPLPVINAGNNVSLCAGDNTTFSATGNGTFAWSPSTGLSCTTCPNPIAGPAGSTSYTLTVTNSCGSIDDVVDIAITAAPSVDAGSNVSICISSNTTLSASGSGTYSWSSPSPTLSCTNCAGPVANPTTTTTYTVSITASCGTASDEVTVHVNSLPSVSANTSAGTLCAGTSIVLFGSGSATSYSWTGGVTDQVGFAPSGTASYTVTGTDINACENTATVSVDVNSLPTVNANTTASTVCAGTSVTLTGSGTATSYTWSGGITNGIGFVPTGFVSYTVTGTDANSCTKTAAVSVTAHALPTVNANTTAATVCAGTSVTLMGSGTATSYTWSGGVTNSVGFVPTGSSAYVVTGTDGNSCTNTATVSITVNSLPTVNANTTASTVCAGTSVTLSGSGTATSYTWSGGISNGVGFVPTSTVSYIVTGTDVNSCTKTATVSVTVNSLPTVFANSTANTICAGTSIILTGSGNAAGYTWSHGVTNGVGFIPTSTVTYTVTGTGGNSCTKTATASVTVNPKPTVVANASATSLCVGSSVTLTGGGAVSYTWSGGVTNGIGFTPISTFTYTVTGTNGNSCTNTANVSVSVNPVPAMALNVNGSIITAMQNSATYQWLDCNNGNAIISGATAQSYTATSNGNYAVIVNLNGCIDTSACVSITSITTGIHGAGLLNQISVYPNPSFGLFTVQSESEGVYSIINELGQTIRVINLNAANGYKVTVEDISNGMHFIVGYNNGRMTKQKIMITR